LPISKPDFADDETGFCRPKNRFIPITKLVCGLQNQFSPIIKPVLLTPKQVLPIIKLLFAVKNRIF